MVFYLLYIVRERGQGFGWSLYVILFFGYNDWFRRQVDDFSRINQSFFWGFYTDVGGQIFFFIKVVRVDRYKFWVVGNYFGIGQSFQEE